MLTFVYGLWLYLITPYNKISFLIHHPKRAAKYYLFQFIWQLPVLSLAYIIIHSLRQSVSSLPLHVLFLHTSLGTKTVTVPARQSNKCDISRPYLQPILIILLVHWCIPFEPLSVFLSLAIFSHYFATVPYRTLSQPMSSCIL